MSEYRDAQMVANVGHLLMSAASILEESSEHLKLSLDLINAKLAEDPENLMLLQYKSLLVISMAYIQASNSVRRTGLNISQGFYCSGGNDTVN